MWLTKSVISLSAKDRTAWLTGLVLGHDFTPKFEMDMKLYSPRHFPSFRLPTHDRRGRPLQDPSPGDSSPLWPDAASNSPAPNQSYFVGYFGLQFLLPPKSYKPE